MMRVMPTALIVIVDRRIASNCTSACCSDNISNPVHPTLDSKVAKCKRKAAGLMNIHG